MGNARNAILEQAEVAALTRMPAPKAARRVQQRIIYTSVIGIRRHACKRQMRPSPVQNARIDAKKINLENAILRLENASSALEAQKILTVSILWTIVKLLKASANARKRDFQESTETS